MMLFAQIFNVSMPWHVLSCPKISGSYGTCLAREIKNGGKGGWTNFWPQCCFLSVTTMKWPDKELCNKCQMRNSEDLLHAKLGRRKSIQDQKKIFMKKVKKSEKIFHLRYFIMDFYHFFFIFFFFWFKNQKRVKQRISNLLNF